MTTAGDSLTLPPSLPTTRSRLAAAFAVGLAGGVFCGLLAARPGAVPDLVYPLTAARLFLEGDNPYLLMSGEPAGQPAPFDYPFFYPFTTVLAMLPLARLLMPVACGLFFGASSALLAYFITRDGLWRLHIFASAPFVAAAALAQFGPLMMVMAFVPAAGFLAAIKPNLGLALLVYRPTWRGVIAAAVFGAASLLVLPGWPLQWLQALGQDVGERHVHSAPIFVAGGFVLALAFLAWRHAAGRLLIVMSLVPQQLFFYDQLPLWLIPRTRNESILLTGSSQLAMLLWYALRQTGDSVVRSAYPYVIALVYLPALILVLRHWRSPVSDVGVQVSGGAATAENTSA